MRQLSGHDAQFVYSDSAHANSNVSLVQIYDQSTAPGGLVRFKTLLAHIESRLHLSPVFRSRLQHVPFEFDTPYWVEDEHFDLEYHVRHIALPKPGDWRQFCIQASRIHARPLDLNRPLWELYVIEGLDSFLDLPEGSFALLTKIHHAAIDLEHGSEITALLHDLGPTVPVPQPAAPWFPQSPPSNFVMLCRGLLHNMLSPQNLLATLGRAMGPLAPAATTLAGELLSKPDMATATRFNSVVSPHRVFDSRRFALADFHRIRAQVPGASVGDAVIAVCAGGLRRYLAMNDELPAAALSAIAPTMIAAHDDDAPAAGLQWQHLSLATDEPDPVQRLLHIHRQIAAPAGGRPRRGPARHAPAPTLALSGKLLGSAVLKSRHAPLANCTITNVAGPAQPLYLCGARMTYFSALMPIADGMGLVFAVTSYDGRVFVSPTSCREQMPDPEVFAQCLRDAFEEYLALARACEAAPRARAKAAAKPASARDKPAPKRPAARSGASPSRAAKAGRPRSTTPRR